MVERLLAAERRIAERVGRLWDDHDVLLMPMMSEPAVPRAGSWRAAARPPRTSGRARWVPFCVLWNSTGQPAASVPAGFAANGLPLAVQLVGRPHGEGTLLALAAQIEAARPWVPHRPRAFDC